MTTTTYAILGLLATRPWTAYELVRQVERTTRRIWPRAQSKLYEEPKKLVALGLATASEERVGRRPRTSYAITPAGRAALRDWLAEPGAGPVLECEALLKIHLAGTGGTAGVRAAVAGLRVWAHEQNAENLAVAVAYRDGAGAFPERAAVNALVGRFLTDWYASVAAWAEWADELTADWPDDPADAALPAAVAAETAAIAERTAERTAPPAATGR